MTKRELINALEALAVPDDTRVVVPGFDESGLDYIGKPKIERVVFDARNGSHSGSHETETEYQSAIDSKYEYHRNHLNMGKTAQTAIVIW